MQEVYDLPQDQRSLFPEELYCCMILDSELIEDDIKDILDYFAGDSFFHPIVVFYSPHHKVQFKQDLACLLNKLRTAYEVEVISGNISSSDAEELHCIHVNPQDKVYPRKLLVFDNAAELVKSDYDSRIEGAADFAWTYKSSAVLITAEIQDNWLKQWNQDWIQFGMIYRHLYRSVVYMPMDDEGRMSISKMLEEHGL